jgi:hypothetical protein
LQTRKEKKTFRTLQKKKLYTIFLFSKLYSFLQNFTKLYTSLHTLYKTPQTRQDFYNKSEYIQNMQNTKHERNYMPLWMRSIQPGGTQELDYVAAVPLCYCKPGGADAILLNIKNSQFDFKLLDYTIDRYIIDSVDGDYTDKYLVFRNDRTTIT